MQLGAALVSQNCVAFSVWAPRASRVELDVLSPTPRRIAIEPSNDGYFRAVVDGVGPGARYRYRLDGDLSLPDPASHFQPEGVHGPSEVVDPAFDWADKEWMGIPLRDCIFYELHVGTFTPAGTLDAAIARLDELVELGITVVELMPVVQFPGARNWGYDGVYPYAVQNSYGGPAALKRFVNAAHCKGLAVALDVVYNHLGPEGNYLAQFGPYFTDRYHTPWGLAVNFDSADSAPVRRYFVENAVRWISEFHIDALRLDAVHAIFDASPVHILREIGEEARAAAARAGRQAHVIAESDLNDPRLVDSVGNGGYGLDAQWSDDFHHSLHALLTGERSGYYQDFGSPGDLAKALTEGFVYTGQHSVFRGRKHGAPVGHIPAERFVVCAQNHDQVGNRMLGERLAGLVDFAGLKIAAGVLLLSPYLPLIFMGEEWAEPAPFLYFVSHADPDLIEAVRRGRASEFASFAWREEPPDPQDALTFERSRVDVSLCGDGRHRAMRAFYCELIRIRKETPALRARQDCAIESGPALAFVRRGAGHVLEAINFGADPVTVEVPCAKGVWAKAVDSADPRWMGPGTALPDRLETSGPARLTLPPESFCLYRQ